MTLPAQSGAVDQAAPAATRSAQSPAPHPPDNPTLIALIAAAALFMEILDATIISPAIPQMAASFGTTPVAVSTGISSYLITVAIFIPASAWLSDRFGARNVFACAIAVFTIASVLCGLAETLTQFTAARVLQGIGGAMMSPVGRIEVMRRTHPTQLLRMIAFVTWPGLSALVIGPPLGGLLTTYLSWRWIFYINVPIGILGIVLVLTFFDRHRPSARRRFDALGFVLTGGALGALIFGIESVSRNESLVVALGIVGLGLVLGFLAVRHAQRHPAPLLSLAPFKIPSFSIGTLWGGGLFRLSSNGTMFILPIMFQVGFGMTAFASGLLIGAYLAGDLGIKVVANRIVRTFGFRNTLIGGTLFVAIASAPLLVIDPQTPLWILVPLLVVVGASRSIQFTALNSLVFADLRPDQISSASALNSMSFQVCAGIGVGLAALVLALSAAARGAADAPLTMFDFRVGLGFTLTVVTVAALAYIRLSPHTGSHVTGHRLPKKDN
ncbi:MFS transporter [Bradyrhizobium sp. LHD-71]|uniref:MFS transporter n=1 Tax=Bradyrhizobium sp. LHD-71 TaxID=3072141 RepID=UPI0028105347|nr:MFS transporter [Bradyrhizobium sp. LHD-71]MDQ8726496.1 MFS transporter [Bradyrhizobium sp. LHD-71]